MEKFGKKSKQAEDEFWSDITVRGQIKRQTIAGLLKLKEQIFI